MFTRKATPAATAAADDPRSIRLRLRALHQDDLIDHHRIDSFSFWHTSDGMIVREWRSGIPMSVEESGAVTHVIPETTTGSDGRHAKLRAMHVEYVPEPEYEALRIADAVARYRREHPESTAIRARPVDGWSLAEWLRRLEALEATRSGIARAIGGRLVLAGDAVQHADALRPVEQLIVGHLTGSPVACIVPDCGTRAERILPVSAPVCEAHATLELRAEQIPDEVSELDYWAKVDAARAEQAAQQDRAREERERQALAARGITVYS